MLFRSRTLLKRIHSTPVRYLDGVAERPRIAQRQPRSLQPEKLGQWVPVPMSDLFGPCGTDLLDRLYLPAPYAARIASLRRVMDDLDFEIDLFAGLVRGRIPLCQPYVRHPGLRGLACRA